MKKTGRNLALIIAMGSALIFTACGGGGDGGGIRKKKSKPAGTVIASPGEAGYDAGLEESMYQYFRQFALLNGIAIGVGYNDLRIEYGNTVDKDILTRYFNQYSGSLVWNRDDIDADFEAFCQDSSTCGGKYEALADNPRDSILGIIKTYGGFGDTGMFGGVAIAADLLRYAVLRDQGYPAGIVEEARQRALHVLEVIDIGNSIGGVPGVLVRGLRRTDHGPSWDPQPMPPETPPPYTEKHNTWREDNTADQRYVADWGWEDNASKDQVDGWIFAMGVAWDVIAEDPDIPQEYRDMLVNHARNFAQSLMRTSPEFETDMLIRDADGKLTQWCDLNPNVLNLEGCWSAGVTPQPLNTFNAIMGLGVMRTLYHITGDEEIRDFYYGDLIGKRGWHEFVRDGELPIVDFGYATNYSNVNMAFIAFYNVLRYETNAEVREVIQQGLERLWDNGRNDRQPKHINQTFFDVIYSGLRGGGNVPNEVQQGIETLKQWPPTPMWAKDVINCDDDELTQGECLAVDNKTIIELPVKYDPDLYQYYDPTTERGKVGLGHNSEIVAEHVLPRRLRGDSNFDWRSNPFAVNYFRNPYEINAVGDIMAAYWLGRYLKAGDAPDRNVSPVGVVPRAPETPSDLVATPVSESQVNLAWTDTTNKEDDFRIERKKAVSGSFQTLAILSPDVTTYYDVGLDPETTYEYRVKAVNDIGPSDYSNIAQARTFPPAITLPKSPGNLSATALDHERIQLNWTDNSDNEQGFLILRGRDGVWWPASETLADVASFTDSGLEDGTTYGYGVIAFNSAGNSGISNIAEARTVKLPGIFAISPTEDDFGVSIYTDEIKVGFEDGITAGQLTFVVSDEVREIDGTPELQSGGMEAIFKPDKLLTMSTQYTVSVTVDSFTYEYHFYTEGPGWPVDLGEGLDKSFAIDIFNATITEPAGIQELLQGLGMEAFLLIGIIDVDTVNNKLNLIGALGDLDAPNPSQQDMDNPTIRFPESADFIYNAYEMGPFDFPITIAGLLVTLEDVMLSGTFSPNYEYVGNGSMKGVLDLRAVVLALGEDPDIFIPTVCGLQEGVCQACAGEPDRLECITLIIENMRGDLRVDEFLNPIPVTPVAAVTAVATGTGDTRTIELTLTHPKTGDPEVGKDLYVYVKSGNGKFENDQQEITVTTDDQGKASVDLTDTDGGIDELKIEIDDISTPVGYVWVTSSINVSFD